jgi:hypothetical protein
MEAGMPSAPEPSVTLGLSFPALPTAEALAPSTAVAPSALFTFRFFSMPMSSDTVFRVSRMPVTLLKNKNPMPPAMSATRKTVSATQRKAPQRPPGTPTAYRPYA